MCVCGSSTTTTTTRRYHHLRSKASEAHRRWPRTQQRGSLGRSLTQIVRVHRFTDRQTRAAMSAGSRHWFDSTRQHPTTGTGMIQQGSIQQVKTETTCVLVVCVCVLFCEAAEVVSRRVAFSSRTPNTDRPSSTGYFFKRNSSSSSFSFFILLLIILLHLLFHLEREREG